MKKILLVLGILVIMFLALINFGINIVGDRSCPIQIQNGGDELLTLKTFQYTNYNKELTVDSITLKHNEKLEIGFCINCSTPDTLDITFNAIGLYDPHGNFKLFNKSELISYLETMDKTGCITYLVK